MTSEHGGPSRRAVVLVGHGTPARDCPPELVARLKALEAKRRRAGEPPSDEERGLDERVRRWPRSDDNDPYRGGLERLAAELRPRLGGERLVVAYNEFCAPSLAEAVAELARDGVASVVVVPSMLTPGGVHSEEEIPETLAELHRQYPTIVLRYAWPFDLARVATLIAEQVREQR